MSITDTISKNLRTGRWVIYAALALIVLNALGVLASFHWTFDLLVNFKLQYLLAAVILGVAALPYKRFVWAIAMFALAALTYGEVLLSYTHPLAKPSDKAPNFVIAQYNKYYYNDDFTDIENWVRAPDSNFDIMVVNESSPEAIGPMLTNFKEEFPHQFPENFPERFNDISILSKWPFTVTPLPMVIEGKTYNISKIVVQKTGVPPVTIYGFHTETPVGPEDSALRNAQLEMFAATVRAGNDKNVIMLGDWNVTPYSPHFKNILHLTRLNHANIGLLPQSTFPSYLHFSLLQMPIDHILYDNGFDLVSLAKGPSLGSDHHSLIARFHVNNPPAAPAE